MGEYHIIGGNKLTGEIRINGGKNAILPILAATVLNESISIIHDCPEISDTYVAKEILESIGCKVVFENGTITVDSSDASNFELPENFVREMRSSIIFLGGVLGRFKKVKISYPGGCELGLRPIDLHLKSIKQFGVDIVEDHGFIICSTRKLVGAKINLDFPSVGATENIMLTAIFAEGETIINNCAKEPEIVDLQKFLNAMGADVQGAGSDTITINGVKKLHDVTHTVMPDRIVAGTYLIAAALTQGEITLYNVSVQDMCPITSKLREVGCSIIEDTNKIHLKSPSILQPLEKVRTLPHPGFPTDMQAQLMSLLALAKGTSIINETIFESRNKHVSELIRMGADIILANDGTTSIIKGVNCLQGTTVSAKDLRGGASLILAGLAAQGKTIIKESSHIERGYESIDNVLKSLGANITFHQDDK